MRGVLALEAWGAKKELYHRDSRKAYHRYPEGQFRRFRVDKVAFSALPAPEPQMFLVRWPLNPLSY